jgi:hypothetical protein
LGFVNFESGNNEEQVQEICKMRRIDMSGMSIVIDIQIRSNVRKGYGNR